MKSECTNGGHATAALNLALPVFCHARLNPKRVALVVDKRDYNYAELAAAAGKVAAWVLAYARCRERRPRVGVLAARSLETYAGILGAAWAGGTYVPLNPRQPVARLTSILQRASLDAIVVDKKGSTLLMELADSLPAAVLTPHDDLTGLADPPPPLAVSPNHLAYIMFTSGTTGVPKGVLVTCGNVAHFLKVSRSLYHITPADRLGQFCEISFDVSVFEMFAAWDAAASLHVVPENVLMGPGGFIRNHELTIWTSVPSAVMTMLRLKQLPPNAFPSLRAAYFIGEALPVSSAKAWQAAAPNCIVDNEYGPTEATVACLVHRCHGAPAETPGRGTVAIGTAYPGMHAGIVDAQENFLSAGEIGELALSGDQLAAGYLDDPEQTARRFPMLAHPTLGTSRWYRSGDYAFQDDRGLFHCLGRIDNQVKIMGHRVELEDLEAHLRMICNTDSVAAVAWPIVNGQAVGIVAFVCGSTLPPAEARDKLRNRVPTYMVPSKVFASESLPLNSNGKVDRTALQCLLDRDAIVAGNRNGTGRAA